MSDTLREKVKVTMHLPEGYTKVLLEKTLVLWRNGICWDIPTEIIPRHLRNIGSRFILVSTFHGWQQPTAEQMRKSTTLTIEEIVDE